MITITKTFIIACIISLTVPQQTKPLNAETSAYLATFGSAVTGSLTAACTQALGAHLELEMKNALIAASITGTIVSLSTFTALYKLLYTKQQFKIAMTE